MNIIVSCSLIGISGRTGNRVRRLSDTPEGSVIQIFLTSASLMINSCIVRQIMNMKRLGQFRRYCWQDQIQQISMWSSSEPARKIKPSHQTGSFCCQYTYKNGFVESLLSYMRAPGFSHIRPSLVIRSKTGGLAAAKQLSPCWQL